MKLTKKQLQKIIKEELEKVVEITASGWGGFSKEAEEERQKDAHRLGKEEIRRLRAAAKADQEDRAKTPRFGKKNDPSLEEQEEQEEQEEEKKKIQDVAVILKYLGKIDTKKEYAQLMSAIIKHAQNIPQGKRVLVALYKELQGVIKQT